MSFESKGLCFSYDIPASRYAYQPTLTTAWYADPDVSVPVEASNRSSYLHGLNVLLENMCYTHPKTKQDMPPKKRDETNGRRRWLSILNKLMEYWFEHRLGMAPEHRQILWMLIARIKFVLDKQTDSHYTVHDTDDITRRALKMSAVPIPRQSVFVLWTNIHALALAWNTLQLTPNVISFVDALFTQIGRHVWVSLETNAVYDHPGFTTTVDAFDGAGFKGEDGSICFNGDEAKRQRCVNIKFLTETERIFSSLLKDVYWWRQALYRSTVHEYPSATRHDHIIDWLRKSILIEAKREGVQELFERRLYDRRAHPGEVERLKDSDAYLLHNSYNAINMFRQHVIDRAAALIEGDTTLEDLLQEVITWKKTEKGNPGTSSSAAAAAAAIAAAEAAASAKQERSKETIRQRRTRIAEEAEKYDDATDIFMCTLATALDDCMSGDTISFLDYFTTTTYPVAYGKRRIPMFIRIGGGWHVIHGEDFFKCANIVDACECWIKIMCDDDAALELVSDVAPHVENFYEAYTIIVGTMSVRQRTKIQENMAMLRVAGLDMPEGYS